MLKSLIVFFFSLNKAFIIIIINLSNNTPGAYHQESATPILSLCHGSLQTGLFLGFFSREIGLHEGASVGKNGGFSF